MMDRSRHQSAEASAFGQVQDCPASGAGPVPMPGPAAIDLRDRTICGRYLAGETLSSIGSSIGLSIEGVRKIARKYGLDKTNAGMAARKRARMPPPKARPAWERVYGCASFLEFREATHAERMAFLQHRTNARRSQVPWELSLGEWMVVWRRSGKWELRGQGPRKFGMSRKDPDRGFTADNVRIARNAVALGRARAKQAARRNTATTSQPSGQAPSGKAQAAVST